MRQTCIFSGSSHPGLVDAICERLGSRPDNVQLRKFANGETSVEIKTSVRDQDVFIVQSGSSKINDSVMELLIMIAACKGGSARSITAVMPYFPYSRQSKRKSHRGAITARMVANLMAVAGVDHVITIDLHASQSQGFFKCPIDNLVAEPILAKWLRAHVNDWRKGVVVSKNPGGTKRVTSLADALKLSFGIVTTDRRRPHISHSMGNSMLMGESHVFGSMGLDGSMDDPFQKEQSAESHIYPDEPSNVSAAPSESANSNHHYKQEPDSEKDFAPQPRRPSRLRSTTAILDRTINRLSDGNTNHSPLSQSHHPDSPDIPPQDLTGTSPESGSVDLSSSQSQHGSHTSLERAHTVLATTQHHHDLVYDSDDDAEEAYNDERARDVVTGRLIHGHLVEDDHPSPTVSSMSASAHQSNHKNHRPSDDDPPEHMMQSFMSTASSRREPGLGGTADATASDEEEEEALNDPELETTITLVGNVKDRPVFIVDDIIDKAGSWIAAAETAVKRGGATKVYCMATHGLFGGDALQEMESCEEIDKIVVTNSFPIPAEKTRGITKLVELDVSHLLSEAIRRTQHGESISQLFFHYD